MVPRKAQFETRDGFARLSIFADAPASTYGAVSIVNVLAYTK
jgi:hypothetical protein